MRKIVGFVVMVCLALMLIGCALTSYQQCKTGVKDGVTTIRCESGYAGEANPKE